MKTNYIIGIGSQRAGSTLLHRILKTSNDIFMHPVKELHYFDTLNSIRNKSILKKYSKAQIDRELKLIYETDIFKDKSKEYRCYLRTNHILSNKDIVDVDYKDLFRPCIMGSKYLGEITPEYMLLREDQIKAMADVIGAHSKIIIIGRHPVDRYISSCKLSKLYMSENKNLDDDEFNDFIKHSLLNKGEWFEQQASLSDYSAALERFKKYFSNVLALDYQQLFSETEALSIHLSDFLDIKFNASDINQVVSGKVNSLGETTNITADLMDTLNIEFKDQIEKYQDYLTKVVK